MAAVFDAPGRFAALRLGPGDDLRAGLEAARGDDAAVAVATCVGSLTEAMIRHADRDEATAYRGRYEIVSLTGTLGPDGPHLHMAIADGAGRAVGGHVMPGCRVYTTAEVVLIRLDGLAFRRAPCARSGYRELLIERLP